jgi:hypothetical protein
MRKIINCLILVGCSAIIFGCAPDYDNELGGVPDPSELHYTVSQDPDYDNRVFLQSQTSGVVPYWDYQIGTTNKLIDTVFIPFRGDYWVKYRVMAAGGSAVDSTMITVSQFDPEYFADPAWVLLTNGEFGRTWKLVTVRAGDAKSTTYSDWGDASWVTADIGDSVYFDLDKGFNMTRYTDGVPTNGTFSLDTAEVLTGAYLNTKGKALIVNGGVKMPAHDPSNEMSPSLKNRFRIFKISNDTLVLGQGAYYAEGRETEGWTYFHWYIRTN